VLLLFFGFADRLSERYPDLFEQGDDGQYDGKGNISSQYNFERKWVGYNTIAVLSENNILNFDAVTRLPVHQCLTFLSYKKDLAILEQEQIRKASKMKF